MTALQSAAQRELREIVDRIERGRRRFIWRTLDRLVQRRRSWFD